MTDVNRTSFSEISEHAPSGSNNGSGELRHSQDAPSQEAVCRFQNRLDKANPSEEKKAQRLSKEDHEASALPQSVLGMTHPLQSLLVQPPADTVAVAEVQTDTLLDKDNTWITHVVESIATGQNAAGEHEVRITVQAGVLPDTEIFLTRQLDGSLNATLVSSNAMAFQTLVAGQDALRTRLQNMGSTPVSVQVRQGTDDTEENTRRRSRGLNAIDTENRK